MVRLNGKRDAPERLLLGRRGVSPNAASALREVPRGRPDGTRLRAACSRSSAATAAIIRLQNDELPAEFTERSGSGRATSSHTSVHALAGARVQVDGSGRNRMPVPTCRAARPRTASTTRSAESASTDRNRRRQPPPPRHRGHRASRRPRRRRPAARPASRETNCQCHQAPSPAPPHRGHRATPPQQALAPSEFTCPTSHRLQTSSRPTFQSATRPSRPRRERPVLGPGRTAQDRTLLRARGTS